MNPNPIVSIICTCYNHEKYVIESIKSVLNQSYKNIQLIVVDDFSTDNSVTVIEDFLKDFSKIQFIVNKKNLGITKSFNNAITLAKGEFYIDLSADDLLLPNCIENQINIFKKSIYKNLAIVYGNAELISENGIHESYYFSKENTKKSGDIYSEILSLNTIICSVSAMYKKSIFNHIGGYDERLSYEDLDFWIRVSRDFEIEYLNEVLVKKRSVLNSLQTSLYTTKNKNSHSTYSILKKAYYLNKCKDEHSKLKKRVNFEILNSYRSQNYFLALKNIILRIKIELKSW